MSLKKDIEKLNEKGISIMLGSHLKEDMTFYSTGSQLLDWAIGGRGFPGGKMTEIYGAKSSGKSLICLSAAAKATQEGKYVIICDTEGNYTHNDLMAWRDSFGFNNDFVIDIPPQDAETIIDTTTSFTKKYGDQIAFVVVDSASALTTEKEMDKTAGEATVASSARLLEVWTRKLFISNRKTAVVFVSQLRANIGAYGGAPKPKGGFALEHNAALRLYVKGKPNYGKDSEVIGATGQEITVQVTKNKIGRPGKVVELYFDFTSMRFDVYNEIIELGRKLDLFEYKPPMYIYDGQKYKGREHFKDFLKENPAAVATLVERANQCLK